jgi:hypothetical protein
MEWIFSLLKKPGLEDYIAAGCIFTNQTHVLAGLQTKRGVEKISGLGGMKKTGESCERTALREMLEELFELKIPDEILTELIIHIKPQGIYLQGTYVLIHYSFEQLQGILELVKPWLESTVLYERFPLNLTELIFERKQSVIAEITSLCLLPLKSPMLLDTNFLNDIEYILNIEKNSLAV